MKNLKKPLLIVLLIVVVVLAIPVVVLLGVDVNPYKEDLSNLVQQQTGRTLKIDGDINKTIFPWFGITLNKVSLGNPEGFKEKDFVNIGKFALQVNFWALFSGQVQIDSVQLEKLELHLLQIPGKNNWTFGNAEATIEPGADSDIKKDKAAEQAKDKSADAGDKESESETPSAISMDDISLAGVKIVDANISFEDRINKLKFAANKLNLDLSHFQFGSPAQLKLSLSALSDAPKIAADINLDAELTIDPQGKHYGGNIKELKLVVKSDLVGKQPMTVKLSSQADFDAAKSLLHVPSLKISNEELKLSASAEQIQATPPGFKGGINIAEMNLRKYLARLGIVMPDSLTDSAMSKFSLDARYLFALDHASLRELKIVLDKSQLSGGVSHVQFSPLGAKWKLSLNQFNLDDYIPPPPPASKDKDKAGENKDSAAGNDSNKAAADSGDAEVLPLDLLSSLDLDGSLAIAKLQARKVEIDDTLITVKSIAGNSDIKLGIKSIGGGSMQTDINLRADKKPALIQSNIKMNKVSAGDILQKLLNNDLVSGASIDFDSKLNTQGNSINAWKRGLGGNVDLHLKDGKLNGVNVMGGLIEKYEKYIKKQFPKGEVENRTAFSDVIAQLEANKGVLSSKKLLLKSPELYADGKAVVDLPKEMLNVRVEVKGEKWPPFISGSDAENLSSVKFPMTIIGPFADPKIDYDVAGPLKDLLKRAAKKKIEKKKEEIKTEGKKKFDKAVDKKKEELKDKLKGRLKGLF